ncbi:CocE/NonD family hydrolase [Frondihabitans cladoniiphilus]|uniref:CocE/NonD family hydrolase n=1 Tax=Frondihabitans cladoniiphilus TaxID=715785 RepID=A0ABP8VUL6_9MICO
MPESIIHEKESKLVQGNIVTERDVMIPMRDGVRLATDIYRPDDDREHPVMVISAPYDKNDFPRAHLLMFSPFVGALRDYVVLSQDARGRYNSEGTWQPFGDEAEDAYDTVEWAAKQPWSNGNVGLYGSCSLAYHALQGAVEQPPHLKAVFAYATAADFYEGWTYSGGAFELGFQMAYAAVVSPDTLSRQELTAEESEEFTKSIGEISQMFGIDPKKMHEHLPNHLPVIDYPGLRLLPYWKQWLSHPSYDEFWQRANMVERANRINVPVLHASSWQDMCLRSHTALNTALLTSSDPSVRDKHRFIIGPWDHSAYYNHREAYAGEREYDTETGSGFLSPLLLNWFDHWLKGGPEKVMPGENGVRFYQTGENAWKEDVSWPPAHTVTKYFLHSDGRANSRFGNGSLSLASPEVEPVDSYVYDPLDPVLSVGGQSMGIPIGVYDQAEIEERDDILVFTTPRLAEAVEIAGPVSVTLLASSSAEDTDFTVKLVDVEPNGYCANITEGIVRARYRNDTRHAEFLVPDETTEFEIAMIDTAHTFREGHAIRVEISSSNFPRFDRNLNARITPALGSEADARKAVQRIFHDSARPSALNLPVVAS